MPDVLTEAQRSYNMSRIRSEKTGPEIKLRDLMISSGLRGFEMHPKSIKGKPDFFFPDRKVAVFVDGCFWHGCRTCFRMPETNTGFWKSKIEANINRDRTVNKELRRWGIAVLRIREHDLKKRPQSILKTVLDTLHNNFHPTVLDLFAGAGGLSEGFIRAGCEMVGHIEMDKNACSTLVTRMIYHALMKKKKFEEYENYVLGKITRDDLIKKYGLQKEKDSVVCAKIGKDNYRSLINQIRERLNGRKLDIIVGGPPCQAYSYVGRARDDKGMKRDSRNFLYRYYVEFLKALKPKIFVFENVPGLETAGGGRYLRDMRRLMKKAGYQTDYRTINAADFGVPQNRKRIILVGWRRGSGINSYPEFPAVVREYKVRDFISDLPRIGAGSGKEIVKFQRRRRLLLDLSIENPSFGYLMDHIARPHTKRDLEIYKRAVLMKNAGKNMKYNKLPKNLKTHKNENSFLDRFKVVDLNATGSHTIVAHIAKDGHFYIHPDLKQNRSLTAREAARLQTFPDDYKFEGQGGTQFRQIGNAVPPLFAEVIAKALISNLS